MLCPWNLRSGHKKGQSKILKGKKNAEARVQKQGTFQTGRNGFKSENLDRFLSEIRYEGKWVI